MDPQRQGSSSSSSSSSRVRNARTSSSHQAPIKKHFPGKVILSKSYKIFKVNPRNHFLNT